MSGERMKKLQITIETECSYQGVTPEERMALRHVFDSKKAESVNSEQFPDDYDAGEQ